MPGMLLKHQGSIYGRGIPGVSGRPAFRCVVSSASNAIIEAPFTVTFTFNRNTADFAVGDITVTNGTAGDFTPVSGSVYTATITPTAPGDVTVVVPPGMCVDSAGNPNLASNVLERYCGIDLPFADDMSSSKLCWIGDTWAIGAGVAVNMPTLGVEIVANGAFDSGASWTPQAGWAIGAGVATGTNPNSLLINSGATTAGIWCLAIGDLVRTGGSVVLQIGSASSPTFAATGAMLATLRATNANSYRVYGSSTFQGNVDNLSCKSVATATLFRTCNARTPDVVASADVTRGSTSVQVGVVLCVDDPSTPANYLVAYIDNTNAKLDKCVAGSYTNLVSGAIAYTDGGAIEVSMLDGDVVLSYKGIEIGTSNVTDAGIIDNTLHGLMSTDDSSSIDNFTLASSGGTPQGPF
jgi:hypothetical protein